MALRVVDDGELAGGDALHVLLALDDPLAVTRAGELAAHDVGRVTVLEHDVHGTLDALPGVARDEVHLVEHEGASILLGGAIAVGDIDDVLGHVLAHHVPWSAAQAEAFTLAYRVEPETAVLSQFASRLEFDDGSGPLAQVAADEVIVVNLPQETDALAIAAVGVGQMGFHSDAAHLLLGQVADGEDDVLELVIGNLGEEIGLILDGIHCCRQVFHAVDDFGRGVMACGGLVKVLAPALLEKAELDHAVAHHVGIGGEPRLDGAQRIFHDVVPVLLMKRHHVKGQAVAVRDEGTHLDVLLGAAIALAVIHADADIEQVEVLALLLEPVNHHGAIDASRYEYCCFQGSHYALSRTSSSLTVSVKWAAMM